MSLLRACTQALPKHSASRPVAVYSRANSTTPIPREKESTQIMTPPEREVMVADAINGAPGELSICASYYRSTLLIIHCLEKPSCVTVQYASTNRHETRCRAVVPRESVGGLTGTSCRVRAGGRTLSWDGPPRKQAIFSCLRGY